MSDLDAHVTELERLGFTIVERSDDVVDAIRCRWHLDLMLTQVTAAARVRRVARVDEDLMRRDEDELKDFLRANDPSILPRGFQKGMLTVAVYLVDEATPGALSVAEQPPSLKFAAFHIRAIRDGLGTHTYTGTRLWGAIYYPLMKFLARSIAEPKGEAEPFGWMGLILLVFLVLMMAASVGLLFL